MAESNRGSAPVEARHRVFVTRLMLPEALELIAAEADLEVWPQEYPPSPQRLREKVATVHGVLINIMDRVDAGLLDAAPQLEVVSHLGVGVDNIDVDQATRRGILVGNTPGVLAGATADLAFALLMSAARRVGESERWLRAGNWNLAFHPMFWIGTNVHQATLGIIGLGQIGLEMAKRGRGFDMRVLYYSRTRKPDLETRYGLEYVDSTELLSSSDFVSLHVPLTPETRHYIAERELRMMKPTAILINVSRGAVVDPSALYSALNQGWIRAAALDVTDPEPIPLDDPLLTLENLVVTPHIGSASEESRREMCLLAARNLLAGIKGQRLEHCVNQELYETKGI